MTARSLTGKDWRRLPTPGARNGLMQLGWPHFWLLSATLGGMLALVGLAFLASLAVA
jgi:hypothetical protein